MSVHIATGIVQREDCVLLVASRYANHEQPLWTLPGGRQEPNELSRETVIRELREETGLAGDVLDLAYASESYDGDTHVANLTFALRVQGTIRVPRGHDHVVDVQWIPMAGLETYLAVAVVREPLLAYLRGERRRYFGYHAAGVSIRWLE